ncbi:MAG: esterase [Rickettsia sp.]|nr:esterase [Rickettsia sp.]
MNHPQLPSLSSNPDELIVLLHGLGSDGHDLISLVPFLQQRLMNSYFFSPHGIEPYAGGAFGRQWFSLQDRTIDKMQNALEKNMHEILSLIQNKQESLGLGNHQTILLGFSQGAMVANYLALSQLKAFKAIVSLSSYLILPPIIHNRQTDFCIIHGQDDEVVDVKFSSLMANQLKKEKIKFIKKIIPNLTHSIDTRVLESVLDFIESLPLK